MSSHSDYAKTPADILKGKLPPKVSVKEPHWYGVVADDYCVLCGVASGSQERYRFPGEPPKDPADRYARAERDWACSSHFI